MEPDLAALLAQRDELATALKALAHDVRHYRYDGSGCTGAVAVSLARADAVIAAVAPPLDLK